MKKWILVLVLAVLLLGYLAMLPDDPDTDKLKLKGVNFNTSLEPSLEAAKSQGKPVFVYVRSENCGWCKKFEAETFTNKSVIKVLNEKFVLVSIDVDKQKNETRNFRVRGTPTEIFLDPGGTEIKRIPGYIDTRTFLETLNEIV